MSAVVDVPEDLAAVEGRVLDVVRQLAEEVGGARAVRAVAADASLEREIGLGSLERVELMVRLEATFGRRLGDEALRLDTPRAIARALSDTPAPAAGELGHERSSLSLPAVAVPDVPTMSRSFWHHAHTHPDRIHVYLREDDGREIPITYGGLLVEASAVAAGLRERGIQRGDRVALVLPTGLDFLRTFQGILLAGAVPVPIYPPVRLDRLDEYARRQGAILSDAGVRVLVTIPRALGVAAVLRPLVPTLEHVLTADELAAGGGLWPSPEGAGSDPAFIQYTSGSTGEPKGVLLTHSNLIANTEAIGKALNARPTDVGVSWLPLYHDMGLIGTWLFCMHHGFPLVLMSPLAFLARPERWLWAFHERRGSLSPAPNFAYELCIRKIPDSAIEGLDLSSWRVALNGAEPVSPDTLERFIKRFSKYGFRRESMLPVYGMAESSVALTFPPDARGPRVEGFERTSFEQGRPVPSADANAVKLVSVGTPVPQQEVRVVDDAGADVAEHVTGRIIFRGPSTTPGYYNKPEATAAITLPGGWLDSGDLGFLHDGELFIAGRRKDLIIKGGRNIVPQEVEEAAAEVPGIRRGCIVAVGMPHPTLGTESLVLIAETRATDPAERDGLVSAVIEKVNAAVGVPPDQVVLVAPGAVLKTSSGKVRRAETGREWREGRLGVRRSSTAAKYRVIAAAAWGEVIAKLRQIPRALFALWFVPAVTVYFALVYLAALLAPTRGAVQMIARVFGRLALFISGARLKVEGRENLPKDGAFVVVANHASYADIPVVAATFPEMAFVAKDEVRNWPIFARAMRLGGHITADRFDAQKGVADAQVIAETLHAGRPVLVFPEGTFSAAAGLRPFRLGAFKSAVEANVPVVPVAIEGTRRALRSGTWLPRPGVIRVHIGAPLRAEGDGWPALVALRQKAADAIAEHCGEPRLDLVAGGPERPA